MASSYVLCEKWELLTREQRADVDVMVAENFSVPLIPAALQLVLIQKGVAALAKAIEDRTDAQDSRVAVLMQASIDDGLSNDHLEKLCDEVAPALVSTNGLLSKSQPRELLEACLRWNF